MNSPRIASSSSILHGDALHTFLDQAQTLLQHNENQSRDGISADDRRAAVIELMGQQQFQPTTYWELERLHDFWLLLGQPKTANELLQSHRETVIQSDPENTHDAEIRLALSDVQSRMELDAAQARGMLLPLAHKISELPERIDADSYWHGWQWLAEKMQAWQELDQGIDLQRVRAHRYPDDESELTFGDAIAAIEKADFAKRRGDMETAKQLVVKAIDLMRHAGEDQYIHFDRWLALAHRSLPIAPTCLPALLLACEQQLASTENPPPSQAVLRHRKAHISRLQAEACALEGKLDAALELAKQGRFGLTDDEGDPFSGKVLQWQVQAGRLDGAAALAWECVVHSRPDAAQQAYRIAKEHLHSDPARAATWNAIMAFTLADEDMRYITAQEDTPELPLEHYLAQVRELDPEHIVLPLIEGLQHAEKRRMPQALPLLEKAVGQHPEFADSSKLLALLAARFACLPLEDALKLPLPAAYGGHWCYGAGVTLNDADDFGRIMGGKKKVPSEEVMQPLAVHYYEQGLQRFEHFWQTGEGMFKDADLHVYSMLCNNLAILYRGDDRYDEAFELHHKGLASSPFAEHHSGLFWCAVGKEDNDAIITEGERLWHFAQNYGYSRHDPTNYFSTVAQSLYRQNRESEISIWIERLEQWFNELDEEEQQRERSDYLNALVGMLDFMSVRFPEQVLPQIRAIQAEVIGLKDSYPLRRLAGALEAYPEHLEESLALHQQAQSLLNKHSDDSEREIIANNILRVQNMIAERDGAATSGKKAWWKFW